MDGDAKSNVDCEVEVEDDGGQDEREDVAPTSELRESHSHVAAVAPSPSWDHDDDVAPTSIVEFTVS